MAITKRSTKGSALSHAEMDANFDELILLRSLISVIGGNVQIAGGVISTQATFTGFGGASATLLIGQYSNGVYIGTDSSDSVMGALRFGTGGAEKFRLTAAGDILVGTVTGSTNTVQVNKSGDGALKAINVSNDGIGVVSVIETNGMFSWYSTSGGVHKSSILPSGTYQSATSVYGGISDKKLKTNVTDARNYLNDLCKVQVRKYNFVNDPDGPQQLGVIAQELETIFPGMVEETPDLAERQKVIEGVPQFEQKETSPAIIDEESGETISAATYEDDLENPIMENYLTGETTKSVKYSIFVPMLITAVQELKAKNDTLEARLAKIEEKLSLGGQ